MKKPLLIILGVIAVSAIAAIGLNMNASNKDCADIALNDVESLTNCERVDGMKDNGHCVSNDRYVYFCADLVDIGFNADCRMGN